MINTNQIDLQEEKLYEISNIYTISFRSIQFLLSEAKKRGLNWKEALNYAELSYDENNSEICEIIPLYKYLRLNDYLSAASGDPAFQLSSFCRGFEFERFGIISLLSLNMPTLSLSLKLNSIFSNLLNNFVYITSQNEKGQIKNILNMLAPGNKSMLTAAEFIINQVYHSIKYFTGKKSALLRIELSVPELSYRKEMEDFFQCPVYLNKPQAAFFFSSEYLTIPNPHIPSDFTMKYLIKKGHSRWLMMNRTGMSGKIRSYLISSIRNEIPSIENTARNFSIHHRVLQKILKEEGTSFREILGKIRMKRAVPLIFKSNLSFEYITKQCGFDTKKNFNSFFKNITGRTPAQLRREGFGIINYHN